MTICDTYNIDSILTELEVALQIDGQDYAEKDFKKIISSVKRRIARQYQVDLTNTKIDDPTLFVDKYRNTSTLFVDSVARIHGLLCGYLQIVRYTTSVLVRPVNVNYLGFSDDSLLGFLALCLRRDTIPSVVEGIESVKLKLASVNNCREKRLFLILVIAYELGFYEVMAAVAEILYLGGSV